MDRNYEFQHNRNETFYEIIHCIHSVVGKHVLMSDQIFISYAHKDGIFVQHLKKQLSPHFKVWLDTAELKAGVDWRKAIDEEIRKSFAVVVVLTPDSSDSKYVTYEWSYALGRKIPVVPILHKGGIEDIHPRISEIQYLDFTKAYEEPWDDLVDQLNEKKQEFLTEDRAGFVQGFLQDARKQRESYDFDNALETYEEALRFASPSIKDDIHYEMALVHLEQRELEKVEAQLEMALDYNPNHVYSLVKRGELYRRYADREDDEKEKRRLLIRAEEKLSSALETQGRITDENGESVWGSLGGIYKRLGEIESAIEAYQKALQVRRSSYPLNNLGLLYMDKMDWEKTRLYFRVVEKFSKATTMNNPGDEWAYNDLLVSQIVLGKLKDAQDTLDDVIVFAVFGAHAKNSLMDTLEKLRRFDVAEVGTEILGFVDYAIKQLEG